MARSYGTFVENNFVNGLVTEASGLNFPENAVTSATNVVFKDDGSVERRLGIDYEASYSNYTVSKSASAINEYVWNSAGGDGSITFAVLQVGSILSFYRVSTSGSLSSNKHATTVNLESYKISGAPSTKTDPCSFASGKGYLFVTHRYCNPVYIKYNTSGNSFSVSTISIEIRDFEGVDDGLDITDRPATLTDAHTYNLYNQGWEGSAVINSDGDTSGKLSRFFTERGVYPNNCDVWWLYLNANESYEPKKMRSAGEVGSSEAPKGYYLLNPFDTDRSGVSGENVTERASGYFRPSCCAFFAGRVFYSGVKASGYAGEIYFSQIIESDDQLGKCHQLNDPTSQHNSDLLPTDGGVIKILDAGEVYGMFPSQKGLIVFASNGIWAIGGTDATTFAADEYIIKKVASITNVNFLSVVDVLGTPVFWTQGAVWTVAYEQGEFVLQNTSEAKIKSFLRNIPAASVEWVKGYYNRVSGILQFLYRSTAPTTTEQRYEYDSVLCLNTKTGAYYPWAVTTTTNRLHGVVAVENASREVVFKYVSSKASGANALFKFAEERDADYIDWDTDSDTAYSSELFSGYKVVGEANKDFQSNYVHFYLKDTTNSSAFVQGCWDFASADASNKWTIAQQVYNSAPTNRAYRIKKVKIRGWGKSLQFRIYSEAGKPFNVSGWSVSVSGNNTA